MGQLKEQSTSDIGCKRKSTCSEGKAKLQMASAQKMLRISLEKNKKTKGGRDKELNKSLYSRYAVRVMVHRGCKLFSELERYHLTEQRRAKDDSVHMDFLKKLASGLDISWRDLKPYKTLDCIDAQEKEWQFAPILVSSNRERLEIVHQKAVLFAKLHKTHVFKWRNNVSRWKNKPEDPAYLYKENPMLWQYFVSGSEAFLTKNINPALGLANGTPVECHSLVLDRNIHNLEDIEAQIETLPAGSEIILNAPPIAVNMKVLTGLDGKKPSRAKKSQLEALKQHSIVPKEEENIVIPFSEKSDKTKTLKMKNGSPLLGHLSATDVTPILAYDLAFAMTVHKAQGRTIKRVVIALTSRPIHRNQLQYASIFVGMTRVTESNNIRLLEHGHGSRFGRRKDALSYLSGLLPHKNINIYNAGFENNNGVWNWRKSLKAKF